jgi:hypothetical protein
MTITYKCKECKQENKTTLLAPHPRDFAKTGKQMSITICAHCGCSQKVTQVGAEIVVETLPDNP